MFGQGTLYYPDGKRFEGGWRDGKKHGRGHYTFPDGNSYVIIYQEGQKHGNGKMQTSTTKTVQEIRDEY